MNCSLFMPDNDLLQVSVSEGIGDIECRAAGVTE
jgi:hypothetical protein